MSGEIRRAGAQDVAGVHELLSQVLEVHAAGRPDLFRTGTRKYTDDELLGIFANDETPVFVAVEGPEVLGHAFCVLEDHTVENNWQDVKTLYIDDICVSEKSRGRHVGTALYRHVIDYARGLGCHDAVQGWHGAGALGTAGLAPAWAFGRRTTEEARAGVGRGSTSARALLVWSRACLMGGYRAQDQRMFSSTSVGFPGSSTRRSMGQRFSRTTWAGLPATVVSAGTSWTTTEPAATLTLSPT